MAAPSPSTPQLTLDTCLPAPPPPPTPLQVFVAAKRQLGEVLSAFEFLDRESLEITLAHLSGAKDPLPDCQVRQFVQPFSAAGAHPLDRHAHLPGCVF